jgi:hypothetical protein
MKETVKRDMGAALQIEGGDGDCAELVFNFNSERIVVTVEPPTEVH